MSSTTVDTIPTYRLRTDTLLQYLRRVFPDGTVAVEVRFPHS